MAYMTLFAIRKMVRDMREIGWRPGQMARELEQPLYLINDAIEFWRRRDNIAKRKCLHCGENFQSDGPGNRICKRCKEPVNNMRASIGV